MISRSENLEHGRNPEGRAVRKGRNMDIINQAGLDILSLNINVQDAWIEVVLENDVTGGDDGVDIMKPQRTCAIMIEGVAVARECQVFQKDGACTRTSANHTHDRSA